MPHSNGEMAALVRTYDWKSTPRGPPEDWPQSLQTAVRILFTSRFAMCIAWGPFLYNNSYAEIMGAKHPWALGKPVAQVWAEIWNDIKPRIETVMSTGEASWDEGLLLFLERSGYPEETYHTFSYSPLTHDDGSSAGMLCVVSEVTEQVINERRLATLRQLASGLALARTESAALATTERHLDANRKDLPFTLTYLFENDGEHTRLVCATGIEPGHPAAPQIIAAQADAEWPVAEVLKQVGTTTVSDLTARFGTIPTGAWEKPPQEAAIAPIAQRGREQPTGFLIAALSPHRPFDAKYAGFVGLITGQIEVSLANARAYEEERKRAEALAELDRAKTEFFSNVSHEFRTPLTLMLGPTEEALQKGEQLSSETLQMIHRNELRLLRLVNSLLDFSRIEAGRINAVYEPTDLATVTTETASNFHSAIEDESLRYTVDCPPLPEPAYACATKATASIQNCYRASSICSFRTRARSTDPRAV